MYQANPGKVIIKLDDSTVTYVQWKLDLNCYATSRGEGGEEIIWRNALETKSSNVFTQREQIRFDLDILSLKLWEKNGINLCDFGVHGQGYKICRFSLSYVTYRDQKTDNKYP